VSGSGVLDYVTESPQTFSNLVPGTYTVTSYFVTQGNTIYGGTPATQSIAVSGSSTPADATVAYSVVTGGTITGTVTSSLGARLAGVSVTIAPAGGFPLPTVQTAGDGTYTVNLVPPGPGQVVVSNVPTGVPSSCVNSATPYPGLSGRGSTTVNAVVQCTPTGWVHGVLASSLGGGIPGAEIIVTPAGGSALYAVTDGIGHYSVATPVMPGNGTVLAIVPPWCVAPNGRSYSHLTTGGSVTVDIVAMCNPLPSDAIVGKVTGVAATVYVSPAGGRPALFTSTAAGGYYVVTGVPVGSGTIKVIPIAPLPHHYIGCKGVGPVAYSGLTLSNTLVVNFTVHCYLT
jgi:hypothetical protein